MREVWPRIRGWARIARDVLPFTTLGVFLLAGSLVALFRFGMERFDLVMLGVGMVGVGLSAVTVLSTGVAAWRLARWEKRTRASGAREFEGECGRSAWTEFRVPRARLPFVNTTWTWLSANALVRIHPERGELKEEVLAQGRTRAPSVVRRFSVGDSFGLAEISFTREEQRPVEFLPSKGALKELSVVRSLATGDALSYPDAPAEGERIDMRRYAAGDPIRFVLWKVYARTGQLMVRTPERAVAPIEQTVAYLVTGGGDEASAGAARLAVESGVLGGNWVFGADGGKTPVKDRASAVRLIVDSSAVPRAEAGSGLGAFLRSARQGPVGRAVLFVPAEAGPWVDNVIAAVRAFAGEMRVAPVEIVIGIDAVDERARASKARRWLLAPKAASFDDPAAVTVRRDDLEKLLTVLAPLHAAVTLVDRTTGQRFGTAWMAPREGAGAGGAMPGRGESRPAFGAPAGGAA